MSEYIPTEVDPIKQPEGRVYAVGINPDILKWARTSMKLDISEAAKKAKIPEKKLTAAENGKERILTFKQLLNLANVYKRAVSIFYLDTVPDDDFDLPDFRTYDSTNVISGQLNVEIREILADRDLLLEVNSNPEFDNNIIGKFSTSSPNHEIVSWIEQVLPQDPTIISGLRNEKLLYYYRDALEQLGILVFQFPRYTHYDIQKETTRGFSLSIMPFPIIAINARDTPYAKIFTLIHEFTHIILNSQGICASSREITPIDIERKCDQIASEFLVNTDALVKQIQSLPYAIDTQVKRAIRDLSTHFKVSYGVIIHRLRDIDVIDYAEYVKQLNKLPEPSNSRDSDSGGGDYTVTWKSRMSPTFLNTVFNAVSNGQIGYTEAMTKMGISSKVFSTMEDLVRGVSIRDIRSSGGDTS